MTPEMPEIPEDDSHELDLVPLFSSSNHDAEFEATAVRGMLEANGIPAILVGPSTLPSLEFQVQVPESMFAEAERLLAEARATGPEAAVEAELASEETQS